MTLSFAKERGGIIPAYAGSTLRFLPYLTVTPGSSPHTRGARRATSSLAPRWRDHPRIRGEHYDTTSHANGYNGIIPAYAGSTMVNGSLKYKGEGSSPHTRGAPPCMPLIAD